MLLGDQELRLNGDDIMQFLLSWLRKSDSASVTSLLSAVEPTCAMDATERLETVSNARSRRKEDKRMNTFSLIRCLQYLHFLVCLIIGSEDRTVHR